MSDIMLFGVLRMPYEMAMADELSRFQFYGRAQEAANRLEAAIAQLEVVQADRRIAWFAALTQRAEAMGFVSIEDALDGFDATRKAEEDRAMQPVQAVPDEWIDVEDRLPLPETDVFVRCLRGSSVGYDVAGMFHGKWMSFATER